MECCRKCTETWLRYLVQSEERDTEFLVDLEDVLWDGLENLASGFCTQPILDVIVCSRALSL